MKASTYMTSLSPLTVTVTSKLRVQRCFISNQVRPGAPDVKV